MKSNTNKWPPFICRTDSQRLQMKQMVMERIEPTLWAQLKKASQNPEPGRRFLFERWIRDAIKRKDKEQLKRVMDSSVGRDLIADRILSKSRRGVFPKSTPVKTASMVVDAIQQIWKDNYEGKWLRKQDNGPFAEEIAVEWIRNIDSESMKDFPSLNTDAEADEFKEKLKRHRRKHGKYSRP